MRINDISIKYKMLIWMLVVAFIPLGILGMIFFEGGKQYIIDSKKDNLLALVKLAQQEVDYFSGHTIESINTLSRMPRTVYLVEKASVSRDAADELRQIFMLYLDTEGGIMESFLLHPETGEVILSSDSLYEGKVFNMMPYFEQGKLVTGIYKVQYSASLDRSIVAISAPVRTKDELLGVLVFWVNLNELSSLIDFGAEISSYLLSRADINAIESLDSGRSISIRSGVSSDGAAAALTGRMGSDVYEGADGIKVVGAYGFIPSLDLALLIEVPLSLVLKDVNTLRTKVAFSALMLALIVFAVSALAGRQITVPLIKMSRAAGDIASGRFTQKVEYKHGDELGRLSGAMNHMARSLAEREREKADLIMTLNSLVEHIPEGIVLLDVENRVVFTNTIGAKYLAALSGKWIGDVVSEISGREIKEFLVTPPHIIWHEVVLAEPVKTIYELAARHIARDDEVTGMVLMFKDVTEERKIAAQVQVQQRLAAVGQLSSGIAHDFNNVLTCVIGYSEMLLSDGGLSEHAAKQVDAILKSGQRATGLIRQILDFSRKSKSEMTVIEMGAFVRDFAGFIERVLPEKVRFRFDIESGEYMVRADRMKLQQVLTNLTVNAVDVMPHGGWLSVGVSSLEISKGDVPIVHGMPAGTWVVIGISDDGPGIAPEVLPHLFEPFYTTKRAGKGTGLGLAQVYGIVKQFNGYIDVTTRYAGGKIDETGSSFMIYLPEVHEFETAVIEEKSEKLPRGGGETVLVVEDDSTVRHLIVKVLEQVGYSVLQAEDGKKALALFKSRHQDIDVCVADIMMPEMDGLQMSREMLRIKPSVTVVAVSGYTKKYDKEGLQKMGIVEWIQKPFQSIDIVNAVRAALKKNRV